MAGELDFERVVTLYYESLYQFAYSLTRSESDACDLTQQTFYIWATRGHQLRDPTRVKTWLFTTLHRQFLETRRRQTRFPQQSIEELDTEPVMLSPEAGSSLDTEQVLRALAQVDEIFQAPVALFYLQDCPYKDIAQILGVPLGTVKSRIARGLMQLQKILADDLAAANREGEKPS